MSRGKRFLILAALMVSLLIGSTIFILPILSLLIAMVAAVCFMVLIIVSFSNSLHPRYRDPYDLRLLKDIHEQKEMDAVDDHAIPENADVVCPHCGHVYGSKFKVCPMCRR